MYLKRLSIHGFKSFANRTSFDYGRGVTAVVGPNGSGKSNVSDAIRWVLGEQSSRLLRAKKQEDVIFAGTGNRAAVGMAEVILTLDNEEHWLPLDFAEVEIGRRVYRSGDSEYLLNGQRVRLRDVADLLMKGDVGQNSYSIMGQGLVDEVLSMTPDDRRSFLDEAADVKRFRMKVKEAQDRLAANRDNTDRIALIISEIAPRLTQLSRQAERAADHRRLSAELAELLRAAYGHRWAEAQNALVRARATLDQRAAEDGAAAARVAQLQEQVRALSEEIRRRRETISRRDEHKSAIEQRLATTRQGIALDTERQAMARSRSEELAAEVLALEAEHAALLADTPDSGTDATALEAADASRHLQQSRAALEAAERDYGDARRALHEARDAAEADERRYATIDRDSSSAQARSLELTSEMERAAARRKQMLGEIAAYGLRFAELLSVLTERERSVEPARNTADTTRERLRRVQEDVRAYEAASSEEVRELDYLEGRLEALRRVHAEHEDVAVGTRNVLAMGGLLDGAGAGTGIEGIVGLLSRQLRVPAGLETAINAALEYRLHAIIVEDEGAAFEAVAALKGQRLGRAQFLPLQSMRHVYPVNLQKERGVVGVASKLIRCERRYQAIADTLLGRVIVVEDVATGQVMVKRGLGASVTLDGIFIDPSGVISGGSSGADEGVFARQRELDELPERIEALRHRTSRSGQQLANARLAIEQLQEQVQASEIAYDAVRREVEDARSGLEREGDRLHRLRREMDAARDGEARLAREQASREDALASFGAAAAEIDSRRVGRAAAIAGAETVLRECARHRESALTAVSEASARVAAIEGERRTLAAVREQHTRAVERLAGQLAARREQARHLELEAETISSRLAAFQTELEAAVAEQGAQGNDNAPDRDELQRFESHERQVQEQLAAAQAELLQLDRRRLDIEAEVGRSENLIQQLRLEMDREGFMPDSSGRVMPIDELTDEHPAESAGAPVIYGAAPIDVTATEARIEELRRQIRRLGPINNDAPEDFDELQQRHTFLSSQLHDLEEAEAQLRAAIVELNEEIRVRFASTFEKVNQSFGEYFEAFFGGGSASLALTDPENVAESGIEIEAQPPGKRLRSLSLLSGGERSLTAVALLFALLTVNPAPFCVLDEVDAALDEANVGRFTAALKQLAERTQFLVVTHNRRTVEIADAIYGVSMMRDGVSKVLSLRIGDLPQN